jgi:hypothetical protein
VLRGLAGGGDSQAGAWYLLGCAHLQSLSTKDAARAFGAAYHADCNLESAALLTFACLKARERDVGDLIAQVGKTWEEMGQPDLDEHGEDRLLRDCLAAGSPPPAALPAPLRLAWLLVPPSHREAVTNGNESATAASRLEPTEFRA